MTRQRIVVLDDYEHAAEAFADWAATRARADVSIHTSRLTGDALLGAIQDADVLVLMRDRTPLAAPTIDRLPRLKHVIFTGARNNALDMAALTARSIPVSYTESGPSKASTCELTWSLILAASKRLPEAMRAARGGHDGWRDGVQGRALPQVLEGERLGLLGLGDIGARVARVGSALGMDVVAWSRNLTPEKAASAGARWCDFDELVATSKVVSLHMVLSDRTRHLVDAQALASMRSDALLVNTSRAGLVDEAALVDALKSGRPAAAALDVFSEEPLPANHPLALLPNAVLTPHLGFVNVPVFEKFFAGVVANLQAWLAGTPRNVLNPEVLRS